MNSGREVQESASAHRAAATTRLPWAPEDGTQGRLCACSVAASRTGAHEAPLFLAFFFPGKNTGVGCHFLLGDHPDPEIKTASPALQADSLPRSHQGSPR